MSTKRREFLKLTGLAGLVVAGTGILNGFAKGVEKSSITELPRQFQKKRFNMSGYCAPIQYIFLDEALRAH